MNQHVAHRASDVIATLRVENAALKAELSAAIGQMRNVSIDLETSTKRTAGHNLDAAIKRVEDFLARIDGVDG